MRNTVRRALHGTVFGSLVVGLLIAAVPASAHPSTPGETDAQHAAADLAGTPMSQIEAQTKANATRITRATGVRPGRRTTATTASKVEKAATAAAANPGTGGQWSSVINTPVVPVFDAVLPNGKVLIWDSVGDGATEGSADQSFTRAMVWNPTTNTYKPVNVVGYNIFCAGYTQLANGNVFVAGGNKDQALNGIIQTHIFNWQTETWSRGPDMAEGRWYPSVTALANGEASIVGGGPNVSEVYQTNNTLRQLTGFTNYPDRIYPFMLTRPDSQLGLLGPANFLFTVDTTGSGTVTASAGRDGINRQYGSFATYDIGKTLVAGGGSVTEDGQTQVPTRTAVTVDSNFSAPQSRATGSMAVPRRQFNLTVLADGSVLATGGEKKAVDGLVDLDNPVYAAERWDPATGSWTTLASASRIRQYHGTATLLPDGRVMTGGGGICGVCVTKGYLEKNVEYFSPPYLFKADGTAADRPVINTAPTSATIGTTFAITSDQAATITKLGLVRMGAPTHGDDQSQRYVPLKFTTSGTTLTATAPATGGIAPPGYYMLFATNSAGVPSVAKIIKVVPGTFPTSSTLVNTSANRCADVKGSATDGGTPIQLYTCGTGNNQKWTPGSADRSLRSLGNCMDTNDEPIHVGTLIELWGCNDASTARWDRIRADGTIRPLDNPALCVGPVGGKLVNSTRLELQTCDGRATQRWSWTTA